MHKNFGATRSLPASACDIAAGERHAIIGPNGAGKSTLFHLITGRLPHLRPDVQLDGENITGLDRPCHLPAWCGAQFSSDQFCSAAFRCGKTCRCRCDVVARNRYSFWHGCIDDCSRPARRTEIVCKLDLIARRSVPAGVLAYAEQRALEIGMTIAGGAGIILLDEPSAGMSVAEAARAVALIRKVSEGRTLIMIEHDMGVVFDLADRISVPVYGQSSPATFQRRSNGPRRADGLSGDCGLMTQLRDLHAYYGKSHILQGVSLCVSPGEIVTSSAATASAARPP